MGNARNETRLGLGERSYDASSGDRTTVRVVVDRGTASALEIELSAGDGFRLVGLSLLVGLEASTLSVRGVVRIDPALAFADC